jgi:serine-type D-Ala-D-Ala carboxypeptidase/endopeptidase
MALVESIVQSYLPTVSPYIGAAVGYASPAFGAHVVCIGSLVDQLGNPMAFTTDTPFEIASVTKTFTATIYELLVQRGRIRRNDTLGTFFGPDISAAIRSVPLFDLANYTSGFPADNNGLNNTVPASVTGSYTVADLFRFLANPPFQINPPGSGFTYSNLGFSLLAIALQAASGSTDFGSVTCREFLGPLGLMKTQPYSDVVGANLPRGFDAQGGTAAPGWLYFPAYYGAGGLVSTPNDMMTWLQFSMGIIQHPALGGALSVTQTPQAAGVPGLSTMTVPGLGWFVSDIEDKSGLKLTVVQKNGDLPGFSSQIAFVRPQSDCASSAAGVFVLVNGGERTETENSAATNIAYDLLLRVAGQEPPMGQSRYPRG